MRVLVVGAGAIGAMVGAKLQQGGHAVTLLGRPWLAEAVRERGLRLTEEGQETVIPDVRVATSIGEALAGERSFDLALIAVKSYNTAEAARGLRMALSAHGPAPTETLRILSLQNGVGNEETLFQHFRRRQVIAGAITTPVAVPEPGHIVIARSGVIGLSPVDRTCVLDDVQQALSEAGFHVERYPDYRGLKWTKLLMNLTANASSAILDWPPERLLGDRRLAALEVAAWREAIAVMRALGIRPVRLGRYRWPLYVPFIRFLPVVALQPIVRRMAGGGRGGKMPSLHIDLHRGRDRSEVGWLNGAVVRYGRQAGVPTPVNQALHDVLVALVKRQVPWEAFAHRPDRLIAAVEAVREGRPALSILDTRD